MILSMTGFGSANAENDMLACNVEIKCLNSKFLDLSCRISRGYTDREIEIRNQISQKLERGKIELNLSITPKSELYAAKINKALLKTYVTEIKTAFDEIGLPVSGAELVKSVLNMPNVFIADSPDSATLDKENELIFSTLSKALDQVVQFRAQEGKNTATKFEEYVLTIAELLKQVEELDGKRIEVVKDRIKKNLGDWMQSENFDANRFEQELIYYTEKFDISEEKVRLKNHIKYFLDELHKASNGKKLNFISQELGREINTIGSKANDAEIQKLVVQMKDELEKIKEQTMNII